MIMNALVALEAAIRSRIDGAHDQPFAVLDFDNTCIVNDVGEATLAYVCRNHLLRYGNLLPSGGQSCDPAYHAQVFRHYHQLLNRGDIRPASLLCARILAASNPMRRRPSFPRRWMRKETSWARASSMAFPLRAGWRCGRRCRG